MDYQELAHMASTRKRVLAHNTRLIPGENQHAVRLHETDVVTFYPDGSAKLDSGGWRTLTTRDRMNRFGPTGWHLCQDGGVWYVKHASDNSDWREGWHPYADGMTLHPDGTLAYPNGEPPNPKAEQKLRRACANYARDFVAALARQEVPMPSGGDCWFCALREVGTGKPLGECTADAEHIREHIRERYFVPSLAVNACKDRVSQAAQWWLAWAFKVEGATDVGSWAHVGEEQVRKAISHYCRRQLGLA